MEGKFWKVLFLVATMRFSSCTQLELFKIKLLAMLHSYTPSENVVPLSCCYVVTLITYVHARVSFVTCCYCQKSIECHHVNGPNYISFMFT